MLTIRGQWTRDGAETVKRLASEPPEATLADRVSTIELTKPSSGWAQSRLYDSSPALFFLGGGFTDGERIAFIMCWPRKLPTPLPYITIHPITPPSAVDDRGRLDGRREPARSDC